MFVVKVYCPWVSYDGGSTCPLYISQQHDIYHDQLSQNLLCQTAPYLASPRCNLREQKQEAGNLPSDEASWENGWFGSFVVKV